MLSNIFNLMNFLLGGVAKRITLEQEGRRFSQLKVFQFLRAQQTKIYMVHARKYIWYMIYLYLYDVSRKTMRKWKTKR